MSIAKATRGQRRERERERENPWQEFVFYPVRTQAPLMVTKRNTETLTHCIDLTSNDALTVYSSMSSISL